jgi:hypothetical protein
MSQPQALRRAARHEQLPRHRPGTAYWNVGCTIVGTAIGALAAVAFA